MQRNNVIREIEEKDLEQYRQILQNVFNNNITYEKLQNLYKISKDNKNIKFSV